MMIHLATDHAGLELKEVVAAYISKELDVPVNDWGSFTPDAQDDFPDFIKHAARAVSEDPENNRAIIFGGSGQGEAMLANRFKNVRAAVYYGGALEIVKLSREHNDANVLSIGARFVTAEAVTQVVSLWLETEPATDPKYGRRIEKIRAITTDLHTT